jgi:2-polyprenyl-6-methoxyphenol hydroxylase-like FAD-dependent oxidoreductase
LSCSLDYAVLASQLSSSEVTLGSYHYGFIRRTVQIQRAEDVRRRPDRPAGSPISSCLDSVFALRDHPSCHVSPRRVGRARRLDNRFVFCLPEDGLALALHIPGPDGAGPEEHRHYVVWFRPADPERTLPDLCTDASGRHHGLSIAPTLVRPEVVRVEGECPRGAAAPGRQHHRGHGAPAPATDPGRRVAPPRGGRSVLIGDAAFVARPHVATGVTKAALDAQCLADSLLAEPDDLPSALTRFERARLPSGRDLVARGRWLGDELIGHPSADVAIAERDRRRAEIMLREYGVLHARA